MDTVLMTLEGDASCKQEVNDQVESNLFLRIQVEDLQKRLEEKENKLTEAQETIRALRQDIRSLQEQLASEKRKYLDLLEQQQQPSHFIQPNNEDNIMVCTTPPPVPMDLPGEMESSPIETLCSDITEDKQQKEPITAENRSLHQDAKTNPAQTVECVDRPGLTLICESEPNPTHPSGQRSPSRARSCVSEPPVSPPAHQPSVDAVPRDWFTKATDGKLFSRVSVRLEDCSHKLGPNGIFILQDYDNEDDDDDDNNNNDANGRDSSDYTPDSDGYQSVSEDDPSENSFKPEVKSKKSLSACDQCSSTFPRLKDLKVHRKTHETAGGKSAHECATCGKSFPNPSTFRTHMRKHTGEMPYTCAICGRPFSMLGNLKIHIGRHKETSSSSFVQATTATENSTTEDLTTDNLPDGDAPNVLASDQKNKCGDCGEVVPQSMLQIHRINHARERPYACSVCGKTFSQPGDLNKHQRTHRNKEVISANACEPLREMHAYTTYPCSYCKRRFYRKDVLQDHERRHTMGKEHVCPYCEKICKTSTKLTQHIRKHTGERPYLCSECPKTFAQSSGLKSHSLTHTQEQPHSCSTCGKAFKHRSSLQNHERTHTGERPYLCHLCGKTFADDTTYRNHRRTHDPSDRPHGCPLCNLRFLRMNNLKRHMKSHTKERPYSCSVCNKDFTCKETLLTHQRIHTGERPYKCDICADGFAHRMGLRTHRMKEHLETKALLSKNVFHSSGTVAENV